MEKENVFASEAKQSLLKGFTLIELLVVIGLLGIIAALGLFISMDFYRSYAFRSERSTIVSVLQKARSQSMNNIDEKRHGVRFQGSPLQYVLFECSGCTTYPGSNSTDQVISGSYNVSITSPALPLDIVFDQLNGNCISASCATALQSLNVTDSGKTYHISISPIGQIDWQ